MSFLVSKNAKRVLRIALACVMAFSMLAPSAIASAQTKGRYSSSGSPAIGLQASSDDDDDKKDDDKPEKPAKKEVPNVAGKNLKSARDILTSAGYKVAVADGNLSTNDAIVKSYSPKVAAHGDTITLKTAEDPNYINAMTLGYREKNASTGGLDGKMVQFPKSGDTPTIKDVGGQIQLLATVSYATGKDFLSSDSSSGITGSSIHWKSEDKKMATVDEFKGIVNAVQGAPDGFVKITATLNPNGTTVKKTVTATIKVRIMGQSGAYPVDMSIVKANGTPYGKNNIEVDNVDATTEVPLYAKVYYSDGTIKCTAKKSADFTSSTIPNLRWESESTEKPWWMSARAWSPL